MFKNKVVDVCKLFEYTVRWKRAVVFVERGSSMGPTIIRNFDRIGTPPIDEGDEVEEMDSYRQEIIRDREVHRDSKKRSLTSFFSKLNERKGL